MKLFAYNGDPENTNKEGDYIGPARVSMQCRETGQKVQFILNQPTEVSGTLAEQLAGNRFFEDVTPEPEQPVPENVIPDSAVNVKDVENKDQARPSLSEDDCLS